MECRHAASQHLPQRCVPGARRMAGRCQRAPRRTPGRRVVLGARPAAVGCACLEGCNRPQLPTCSRCAFTLCIHAIHFSRPNCWDQWLMYGLNWASGASQTISAWASGLEAELGMPLDQVGAGWPPPSVWRGGWGCRPVPAPPLACAQPCLPQLDSASSLAWAGRLPANAAPSPHSRLALQTQHAHNKGV